MRHLFCTFLLLFAAAAFAKGEPEADTFLYRISKQGRPVSYLLGTIHVGKRNSTLPADYRRALGRVSQLVVETDEESMSGTEIRRMQQIMADTRPLKTSLGEARIQRLQRILTTGQEPLAFSPDSRTKPWVLWMAAQSMFTPKGYSYRHGIDHLLIQTAKKQQKPVIALEGAEQLDYFDGLPEDAVIRSLDSLVTHHRAFLDETVSLERDYRARRARKIWAEIANPAHQLRFLPEQDHPLWHEFLYQKLLTKRNQTWLPRLIEILPQKPTLVAVGSAHLFGGQGLIVRLRQVGYQVEPVQADIK
ncbi:TraB/GumN family protein [Neisseria sp. CCUG12390]|uniref:TraB/GumN family protein n=1 Tax=Neisseria sp. CCUG12390 TaxID=3392035 RepID=UPI003A0FBF54